MENLTRRAFAGAAAFMIVPRHVLGAPFIPPSDRITLATIGLGRQGQAVTMELLARPDVQVVAVCDCNRGSKDYAEYGSNALLNSARRLLGPGYENWGEDLASPGEVQLTREFRTSLGMGGREPAKRLVDAYYGSRKESGSASYKGCGAYRDFRELLEKEKDLDAVYVATPDHWHAPISLAAMRKHKHVLCQKPMTHSIGDARRMAQMAREMKVATSLPVNNPSSDSTRLLSEWIADGAIGHVREVHNWSSRPFWPQGIERPKEAQPVPDGLDWDLWLGPAEERPFNHAYLPFVWRGWYDFGCGSFGDMGCYSFAGVFKILGLTPPLSVEASSSESYDETYPRSSIVHLNFPARDNHPAVHMAWYDGGLRPPRPAGLKDEDQHLFQRGEDNEGIMYVGDKGMILANFSGDNPRVYPESKKYQAPPRTARRERRRDAAVDQWLAACKGGPTPLANFEIQSPVTEAFLLGCIAQHFPGERLDWDTANMHITSSEKINRYVDPPARSGLRAKEEVILKRREFIINAGTGALALSASRSAQSQTSGSGSEAKRERICISTWSFHNLFEATRDRKAAAPDKPLDILDFPEMIADRYHIHNLEIVRPHFASSDPAYIRDVKKRLERSHSRLVNIPVDFDELWEKPALSAIDAKEREKAISMYAPWIEIAHDLGARSVRCDPGIINLADLSPTIESYKTLVARGRLKDIRVIVENHGSAAAHPEDLVKILKASGAGALPDFGNFPDEETRARGLRLMFPLAVAVCHAKLNPAKFDFARCMQISKDANYNGVYSVEAGGRGDAYEAVQQVVDALIEHL